VADYKAPEVKETVRGLSKLTEETGELLQLLGKLAVFPSGDHPDGKGDLYKRVAEEIADVRAALIFFQEANSIDLDLDRVSRKYELFRTWF